MMHKRSGTIPVNNFGGSFANSIVIERIHFTDLPELEDWNQPERHDRNSFFLVEKGSVTIEIDFRKHIIKAPSIIYMHPDQVHRVIAFKDVTVSAWAIDNENLNPEYLAILEDLVPVMPLRLPAKTFSLVSEAVSLCIKFSEQKENKLYTFLLKDSCNTLVALVVSLFMNQTKSSDKLSRAEEVNKSFKRILEKQFPKLKRPTEYARILNISTPYMNECVRTITGFSVTHHIQHRIILEAKRLLFHSDQSVKEIAASLGYDDYPYFSRLFTKVAGVAPLSFRNKNFD